MIVAAMSGSEHGLFASRSRMREADEAVMRAYRWEDRDLGHGHNKQPNFAENERVHFAIFDAARTEVLRRFAELNRQRYEEEQSAAPTGKPRASNGRAKAVPAGQGALALVDAPEADPETFKTKATALAKKTNTRRTSK